MAKKQKHLQKRYFCCNKPGLLRNSSRCCGVSNRASIMIICIWLLISLAFLAVSVGRLAFSQIRFSRFYLERKFSYCLTKAAVREVCVERDNDATCDYDTLYELRSPRAVDFMDFRGEYYLIDEESKININTADKQILEGLFRLFDAESLADDIIEYREEEHLFVTVDECCQAGVDEELLGQIESFITVNSNGGININTACEEVLLALGCQQDSCRKILQFRRGYDETEATLDDGVFDSQATISSIFDELGIDFNSGLLQVKSFNYTVKTLTYTGERECEAFDVIYCFTDKRIESWKRAKNNL